MKKGINIWAFGQTELSDILNLAENAKFDGIELAFGEDEFITENSTEAEIINLSNLVKEHNLELYSLSTGQFWDYPLTSENSEISKKAKYLAKKQIDAAKLLGCESILLLPGTVTQEVPYDKAYHRAIEALNELGKYASQQNVVIGVENVWNNFLLSPLEMRDFIDQVNNPFVKAYFDVGNVIREGFAEQWIDILGSRIDKVHIKDYLRSAGNFDGFVEIFDGDVNYKRVIESLVNSGYDGWLTAEMFPKNLKNLDLWIMEISLKMDKIMLGENYYV